MSAAIDLCPQNKEFFAMSLARKPVLRPAMLGGLAIAITVGALAGCSKSPQPSGNESSVPSHTAPVGEPTAKPGISASDARLVLPIVPGRPGAAYFKVHNDGTQDVTLVGVHVADAGETQMHRTQGGTMAQVDKLPIAAGGSIEFAPGALHAMVFGLGKELKAGGTSELTLTFADGDKVSIPLAIEGVGPQATGPVNTKPAGAKAGSAHDMSGMEGMDHDMPGMQH